MRNRLVQHIIAQVTNPNPPAASEVISAQSNTIRRLSDAYEKLNQEHQTMRQNYRAAWDYFKELHDRARKNSRRIMFDALCEEIQKYEGVQS
jgi:hypothetical protein